MKLDPETLRKMDPLGLTNTITLSALIAILIRKGVLEQAELVDEIRRLRQTIGAVEEDPGQDRPRGGGTG